MFLESGIFPSPFYRESPVWIPAPGGGGGDPFITGFSSFGSLRNDYGLGVGFAFTVGASDITVTHLGRLVISGNSETHVITLYSSTVLADAIGNVTIDTSGQTPGSFVYSALGSPLVLTSGNTYYLLSKENSGGDQWYDFASTVPIVTSDATLYGYCYDTGASIAAAGSPNTYGPPNFLYHL